MEFFFFLSVLLSLTIFIYLSLIRKPKTQRAAPSNPTIFNNDHQKLKLPLPPGTTGWPLIGETIDYISKLKNGVPEFFVTERFKKYSSKVFKTSIFGHPMAFLYGAEGNKFLFLNELKHFQVWFPPSYEQLFARSDSLSVNDRQQCIMLRKILAPFVKGEGLQNFMIGKMDSVMKNYLQTSWDCEEIKAYVELQKCTLKLLLSFFLSVDHDSEKLEQLSLLLDDFVAGMTSLPVNLPGTTFNRAIKASNLLCEDIKDRIKQRKIDLLEKVAMPIQDVMSHLLLTPDENGHFMSENAIAFTIQGLIMGGYNNFSLTLVFIVKFLAELPDVYHEVLREQMEIAKSKESEMLLNWDDLTKMKYSWNVAREVMRLHPTGVGSPREVITDFTYAGYTIPKGWKLHWIANTTHRNPEYFPNPEKFDPSRFDGNGPSRYAFVPFGGGPRMCPGTQYAKVAILVFMHNVVTKFKWEKLIPNEEVINGPTIKFSQGLPIRLYPHQS